MLRADFLEAAERLLEALRLGRPKQVLRATKRLADRLTEVQDSAIDAARSQGASWEEIGHSLGISRQAAWERSQRQNPRP